MNRYIKWIRRAGYVLATILLLLLLIWNGIVLYVGRVYGEEQIKKLPVSILVIASGSMEPKLSVGDGILVRETPYEKLKVGDIITFENAGELIAHQIVRIGEDGPVTKGLANTVEDGPVSKSQYRAKVIFNFPGYASFLAWTERPISKVIIIVILFLLFFGWKLLNKGYEYIHKCIRK